MDSARWNPCFSFSLGPAEQQSPRATVEYSLNEFVQQQWGGQAGARRYEGGFEHSITAFSACKVIILIRTQQFLFTVVPNIPHATALCEIYAKAQQTLLFKDSDTENRLVLWHGGRDVNGGMN